MKNERTLNMKTFLFATLVAMTTAACAKEEVVTYQPVPGSLAPAIQLAEAKSEENKTKKVCLDKLTKDGKVVMGKDGKPVQDCKDVKVHKKLEGTKVPPK